MIRRIARARPALLALLAGALLCLPSCFTNNPYRPSEGGRNIYYDWFREEPKHFDPAIAYSEDAYEIINQIYETPVQYHYLKRPYTLAPLTAEEIPEPKFYDKDGKLLSGDAPVEAVAKAVYDIRIKPGMMYENHPCFTKGPDGPHRWHLGPGESFPKIEHPSDLFRFTPNLTPDGKGSTREVTADDFVYQIKRLAHPVLAHPAVECPIASLLANYIEGFEQIQKKLGSELERIREERRQAAGVFYNQEADERENPIHLDLRKYDLPGAQVVDAHTYRITLSRKYPQFVYWLAMPFFCPIPWEAGRFFTQAAAAEQNITLDRFPVGSGPFILAINEPNFRMVMRRNPNYHGETYPAEGHADDESGGLLSDRGKPLPFIEEAVFMLDKESAPRWTKFLQGYYDTSGIASDMFDQAVRLSTVGSVGLTDQLKSQNIRLLTAVAPSTYYYGFNMLDEVVGGYDEKKKKLRQALSIALNQEEYVQIFRNGRGIGAQGPIPPGIFGYQEGQEGINPFVYEWDDAIKEPRRKTVEAAKKLLAEAGFPGGRDAKGDPLVIFYDTTTLGAESKAYWDWLRKQFDALGIQMQVRATDYNRFQEKVLKGNFQFLSWGWNADYPDPENFLFMLYGPNSKVKSQGENAANYDSPRFNELFKKMENMSNGPERAALIKEMLAIVREDAPWMWGFHPVEYGLYHEWYKNAKPMSFGKNALKYKRVEPPLRDQRRAEWNEPVSWPLWAGLALLVLGTIPAALTVYRRERSAGRA